MSPTDGAPEMTQFRLERGSGDIVHLVFDAPGRSMNVFSNKAIQEIGAFADWLKGSDTSGVVIRSGKDTAFCAGADLTELGVAYDMIIAARPEDRFNIAFDHFFALSRGLRALETAGKPIAAAIAGLALGGGCELALAAHYRVLSTGKQASLGLPESLVGLLPGAGGTQRLPRLTGVEAALPILLDGARLSGQAALQAGVVHDVVEPGEEVDAAERWIESVGSDVRQPWDDDAYEPPSSDSVHQLVEARRTRVLQETLGHYPAPLAILDCVQQGAPQSFDAAIRTEMSIFSHLIQRREPRNMIQTLFLGKLDHDRAAKKQSTPPEVAAAVSDLTEALRRVESEPALVAAGFGAARDAGSTAPLRRRARSGYWFQTAEGELAAAARTRIAELLTVARRLRVGLTPEQQRMADYAIVAQAGFPAYLGGPFALSQDLDA